MAKHAQDVTSNKITEAQYNFKMNQEVTILVSRWATQWGVGKIFKGITLNKDGNTRGIGNFVRKHTGADITSAAGVAWFRSQLNESEFQQWLASKLLMDITLAGKTIPQPIAQFIGGILSPIVSVAHQYTDGIVGPTPTGAEVRSGVPNNSSQPTPTVATQPEPLPQQQQQQQQQQPATASSSTQSDAAGIQPASQAGLIDIGAGWMKDPTTGAIYPKLQ